MKDETDTTRKDAEKTLHAYCDCAKRETTWVRSSRLRNVRGNNRWDSGWQCLNCGKFRPDED
jgi:hypothetical protein